MKNSPYLDLNTPQRMLLGPGPSSVSPRVLRVMATPLVGHLDPEFLSVLDEEQQLLRYVFQTKNEITLAISGTGSSGMEAALCNFIEPGDRILVVVIGYFGERLYEVAKKYGAIIDRLEYSWGEVCDPSHIESYLNKMSYKLVAMIHGETSTGALQPDINEIATICHRNGSLLVLDTVATLGGIPVEIDLWDVDIAYSGSQKCLSCPPGLAPITIGPRAVEVLEKRKTPVASWYLDLQGMLKYWLPPHSYHHTVPINLHYALRESLRIIYEEGLDECFKRHQENAEDLWFGLEAMNLPPFVPIRNRMVSLTTPKLFSEMEEASIRQRLLNIYNIEIAGGFGPLAGRVWRIGLMGYSSKAENVTLLLAALGELLG